MSAGIDRVNDTVGAGTRWLTLIMILIGAVGALLRYFSRALGLSMNLTPLVEAQWYAFSLIFLLGAAYGVNRDVHVRVDVLFARLTARTRAIIDIVGNLMLLIPFSIGMLWLSYRPVMNSWRIREMSPDPGGLPRYPIKALILVSFALLVFQGVSQLVKLFRVLRGERVPELGGVHYDPENDAPAPAQPGGAP